MSNVILDEIDKLKMMVMMEQAMPHKSAVEEFEEWVAEMQCRHPKCSGHYPFECSPNKYAEYKTILCLVEDLYSQKNNTWEFNVKKPEVRKIISEVVAMVMYVQEKK